jgi:hypothetical protein
MAADRGRVAVYAPRLAGFPINIVYSALTDWGWAPQCHIFVIPLFGLARAYSVGQGPAPA